MGGSTSSGPDELYAVSLKRITGKTVERMKRLDTCHVTRYKGSMIKTFFDKHTKDLYETGKSKKFPPDLLRRAIRRLEYIDLAAGVDDLKVPPSNRLHPLKGGREGQYAISINDQWRICFRFVDGDAYDVEITDYHS
jgi:proteic killer suppression protein